MKHQSRNRLLSVFLALFSLASWECFQTPSAPVAPIWEAQLSIPLIDTVFYLRDALAENPEIFTVGSSYEYRINERSFDPVPVGDSIWIFPDSIITAEDSVGPMELNIRIPLEAAFTASELLGSVPPSDSSPVPEVPPHPVSKTTPTVPNFEYAHLEYGELNLTIRNNLPVQSDLPNGIMITNTVTGDTIAAFPSVSIPANSSWSSSPYLLNDKVISNSLTLNYNYSTPGSNGNPVMVAPDSGLFCIISFTNTVADEIRDTLFQRSEITANIKPFELDDSTYLVEARFGNGKATIQIENFLPVAVNVTARVNLFRKITTGNPLEFSSTIPPGLSDGKNFNMNEWKFEAPSNQPINLDSFSVSLTTSTLTSLSPVTIKSSDKIRATIRTEPPFTLTHIAGVVKPLSLNINENIPIDLGQISNIFRADSILLDTAAFSFKLKFFTAAGHPADLDLGLYGVNQAGNEIGTPLRIPAGGGAPNPTVRRISPNVIDSIEFTNRNSNLNQFISQFISQGGAGLKLKGTAVLNPPDLYATGNVGLVNDTMQLYSSFSITAPLKVAIFNGSFTELTSIGDSGKNNETKIDTFVIRSIKSGSVFFLIENALPMTVDLQTQFRKDTLVQLVLPKAGQSEIKIAQGTPQHPESTSTPLRVSVSRSDAEIFNIIDNALVRVGLNSEGQMVTFSTDDYIRVRCYASFVVKVDPNQK